MSGQCCWCRRPTIRPIVIAVGELNVMVMMVMVMINVTVVDICGGGDGGGGDGGIISQVIC